MPAIHCYEGDFLLTKRGIERMMARRAARPIGDVVARRTDGGVVIDHADPFIRVSGEFLTNADPEFATFTDGILTLKASNRTVVYRADMRSYDPRTGDFLAELQD